MEMMSFFKLAPSILTIAPTYKCTAACKHCCFRCTPKITKRMDTATMLRYMDEAISTFKTIKGVVFTGGECFLVAKDLPLLISRATNYNLFTRIVSNGYWATTFDTATNKLRPLVEAGLKEINFSTGDNHQKFVPLDNIINGVKAAYELGIRSMCISIETDPCSKVNYALERIQSTPDLASMIQDKVLIVINGTWMHFHLTENESIVTLSPSQKNNLLQPCENIFDNIFITPHSQMLSCCGITVEYNKYLKAGNLQNNSIIDLYREQCNDLFKIWLHIEGPAVIYSKMAKIKGIKEKTFSHKCAYCLELVRNEENVSIVKKLIKEELPNILYKYEMRNNKLIL